jgi:hypothetical protein
MTIDALDKITVCHYFETTVEGNLEIRSFKAM